MMNEMNLDDIKAMLEGITQGEWEWNEHPFDRLQLFAGEDTVLAAIVTNEDCDVNVDVGEHDAAFIAAAPRIVRQLVAEVEAVTRHRDALMQKLCSEYDDAYCKDGNQ